MVHDCECGCVNVWDKGRLRESQSVSAYNHLCVSKETENENENSSVNCVCTCAKVKKKKKSKEIVCMWGNHASNNITQVGV